MRYCSFIASLFAALLLFGCSDKPSEIKSALSAGDKVLIETPDEIFLSLNNDSLVVRHGLKDNVIDTIFISNKNVAENKRLGVVASSSRIMFITQTPSDSILALSYEIAEHKITNSSLSYGLGIMPYQGTDSIKIVVLHDADNAIYEASYYIRSDATGSPTMALNKTVYQKPKQAKRKSGLDDPFLQAMFGIYPDDGHIYWWQCRDCGKSVKSSGKPPHRGCPSRSDGHNWSRGSRAD